MVAFDVPLAAGFAAVEAVRSARFHGLYLEAGTESALAGITEILKAYQSRTEAAAGHVIAARDRWVRGRFNQEGYRGQQSKQLHVDIFIN